MRGHWCPGRPTPSSPCCSPPCLSCGSPQSLKSGESVAFVRVFSGDNDVLQDPGHCCTEPQNQLGPQGRWPVLPCPAPPQGGTCIPRAKCRASGQEGPGIGVTGSLGWRGQCRVSLESPVCSGRPGTSAVLTVDGHSCFLSHGTWAQPGVLSENSSLLDNQENSDSTGQLKAPDTSLCHPPASVPVVLMSLPGRTCCTSLF